MAKQKLPRPNQFKMVFGLTKYALRASFRNKASYFFSLIFPLIFVIVFGSIGGGGSAIKLGVSPKLTTNDPIYAAIKQIADKKDSPIELVTGTDDDLANQLKQSKLSAILDRSDNPRTIDLVTSNNNPQGQGQAQSILNGIIGQMNLRAAGVIDPLFNVSTREISGKEYRYIDFALPGQIGFSLLSIATFGIAFPLITLRKTLVLKRMFATSVTPFTFVVSQCLSRSFQAMLQAVVILLVGVVAFHFTLANGLITVIDVMVLSFLAVLAFLGFGILVGNIARDEQSLPIALNLFNLPQILLAGVFFPIDGMPKWLQYIGNNLPLAYFNTSLRHVTNDGATILSQWPYLLGIIAWGLVAYYFAAKVFKTE